MSFTTISNENFEDGSCCAHIERGTTIRVTVCNTSDNFGASKAATLLLMQAEK